MTIHILEILLIAFSEALDAFAVSIAYGVVIKKRKYIQALRMGGSFGFFQMLMTVVGWGGGLSLKRFIGEVDHWIAFVLLTFIGVKMIWEALKWEALESREKVLSLNVLLFLSLATSIDAFAIGVSFAMFSISMVWPVVIIGLMTLVMSYAGFLIGNRFGHVLEKKVEIAGGLILIVIAVKILITHLTQ